MTSTIASRRSTVMGNGTPDRVVEQQSLQALRVGHRSAAGRQEQVAAGQPGPVGRRSGTTSTTRRPVPAPGPGASGGGSGIGVLTRPR